MGLLRNRGGDGGTKYRMREKVFAIGDDFWIENEDGEHALQGRRQGVASPRHVRARGRRQGPSC